MPAMQQRRMVFAFRLKWAATRGQRKAPAMPLPMLVMLRQAMEMVDMCNSVRAKSTAVPEMVATLSERRNHAVRKRRVWRRRRARRRVW